MNFEGLSAVIVIFLFFAIPLSLVMIAISTFAKRMHRRKNLERDVVITEYEAPEGLSPAEVGYLFDAKVGKKEFIATVLHLEQRGLVSLEQAGIGGIYAKKTNLFDNKPLKPHEKFVLNNVQARSNLQILSMKILSDFNASVAESLYNQGFIRHKSETRMYYLKRFILIHLVINVWIIYYITANSTGNPVAIVFVIAVLLFIFFPFFAALALLATIIYNKIVGYPGLIPKKLKKSWSAIEGFRDYVQKVELDRLQFENEEVKEKTKNKALPYAVALNMDTAWKARFE